MAISADYILDRIKLKRQIAWWKVSSIFLLSLLLIFLIANPLIKNGSGLVMDQNYIARIFIEDIINNDFGRLEILKEIAEDSKIKAVVIRMNSPGGTTVGGETLHYAIRSISEVKPVVTVIEDFAASTAYMAAIASDYILARNSSITGSIGVIIQTYEFTELAKKIGVKFNSFKSSPLKSSPMPMEEVTQEVKDALKLTVQDTYQMFLEMVSQRRNISFERLKTIADGRVYTGRQALNLGLIDAIGDEKVAVEWLKSVRGLNASLSVREVQLQPQVAPLMGWLDKLSNLAIMIKNLANLSNLNFF
jgi:protease IV